MKGMIFDIKRYALHDGPGIRQTIFFKGCTLRCWWCHNPESQSTSSEAVSRELKMDGKSFFETVTVGQLMTVDEVMSEIKRESVFFDESRGGVTFSGGEPLLQVRFLKELATECRKNGISTALDTCGYATKEAVDSIAGLIDLFLFDLKFIDDEKHRDYTGVSNRIILENLRRLSQCGSNIIIRFPVVPGVTDTDGNIEQIITLLQSLPEIKEIDLLPYHTIGKHKYEQFGIENKMMRISACNAEIGPPESEKISTLKRRFEENGYNVKVGG